MAQFMVITFDRYNAEDSIIDMMEADTADDLKRKIVEDWFVDELKDAADDPEETKEVQAVIEDYISNLKLKEGEGLYGHDDEESSLLVIPMDK